MSEGVIVVWMSKSQFYYDFRHVNNRYLDYISIFVKAYLKFELEYNVNKSFGRLTNKINKFLFIYFL